ncbi:hypothetical protein [Rhizobium laguerreae]|uniref:hypothetical protein n=1 Tax=Rhizobium laguerreae TaxID=1076926 RepID=UPI001C905D82|nr:hypothetical protein [Rhizobium laguerreae]MBY3495300.1 hypothetical protein [Rhizobium laguerreae]
MSLNDTLEARHLPGRVTPVIKEGLRHKIRRADETSLKTLQIGDKPAQSRDLLISVELHDSRASTKIATRCAKDSVLILGIKFSFCNL